MCFDEELVLRGEWSGFDLVKVGSQPPMTYRRGELLIISGCITTVSPMKNQAGWDLTIGHVDPRNQPDNREVPFLAPMAMSRYEGIYQCGTSMTLKGKNLTINFGKSTNPMVLHLSGFCCVVSKEEPIPITVAQYQMRDWMAQSRRDDSEERVLEPDELHPPALHRHGDLVFLQGELKESVFGPISQYVGTLPEGCRPKRELRCLANLLEVRESLERVVEHSVAVSVRPDGTISVQGGKVQIVDQKGNMRLLQTKKKGRLCLDGIRFSLVEGQPIKPSPWCEQAGPAKTGKDLSFLVFDGRDRKSVV